ncbi:MAG: magnesium-translocating P-type ATPase [Candidatus Riflebacteria bacterium]|nr:magnesium-translocating P-type ATPase [Candidatus Riflebacteria bacterium]
MLQSEQNLIELCRVTGEKALEQLNSSLKGLNGSAVERARAEFGPNEVAQRQKPGFIKEIAARCQNPLVVQLLVICGISLFMGDVRAAVVVGGMIILSVTLGYIQEARSNEAAEKLRQMVQTTTAVVRDGKDMEVHMSEIVPGDIIILDAGSIIPADLRLLTTKDFFVGQSALTGEAMPVEKQSQSAEIQPKSPLELPNACFQGSTVISGSARGVAVNTGRRTYFGSISEKLALQDPQTSFDRGIAGFTWLMIRFMMVMVSIVFLIVGITKHDWAEALLFALSVAVGLTPEMLPMMVTVNLSKGALAMSGKKVIVKKLNSIQNFGAIDVLCTDKTGTLTQDKIILEKYVDVANRTSEDVLRYAYMNSHYQTGLRNILDRAILNHEELDVEKTCRKIDEIPFDFQRKRMSVIIEYEGSHVMICKGAVDSVYKACTSYQVDDEIHPLIDVIKNDIMEEYEALSADGYRVLAIAYREFPRDKHVFSVADEAGLVILGYIAFLDPPKDSAKPALDTLRTMGVGVKVLTGDNALVTRKVCREVGLDVARVITGDELMDLSDEKIQDVAEAGTVFAALSPTQKQQLVEALQKRGHVVGYMGDGINDAPAMKAADVGISVESAVDVAKEAADIILLEKSLQVLEDGIIEGRKVFGNIIKYIRMGASSNFGNMFSVLGGSYFLPFLPMAPIQVLVNNLLYDVSQVGIPTDTVDEEYLRSPRQWNIDNIRKFMIFIGPMSSIYDYATYFLMLYFFNCQLFSAPGTSVEMKTYYESLFHTGWFVESLLTQTLIVHIIRTQRIPFLQSNPSPGLLLSTVLVMIVGAVLPYTPFAHMIGLVPLPWTYWVWIIGFLVTYSMLTHLVKTWFFKKYGAD